MCRGQGSRRVGNLAAGLNRCGDGRIDIVHQSVGPHHRLLSLTHALPIVRLTSKGGTTKTSGCRTTPPPRELSSLPKILAS